MPRKTITQTIDDLDGKVLSDDTVATKLALDGIRYELYLSPANVKKLHDALEPFTSAVEAVPGTTGDAGQEETWQQFNELRGEHSNNKIKAAVEELLVKFPLDGKRGRLTTITTSKTAINPAVVAHMKEHEDTLMDLLSA
jgi:hypothetical protein